MSESASQSRIAQLGRAAPLDSAAAVASLFVFLVALTRPELLDGVPPEQAVAALTGLFSLAASWRSWSRYCKRRRAG